MGSLCTDHSSTSSDVSVTGMSSMVSKQQRIKSARAKFHVPDGKPMFHVGYEGARHMTASRVPSARGRRTSSIRVVDLNDDTTKLISDIAQNLKRLDLSNLHLVKLEEDFISQMKALECLDIGHNEISEDAFPSNFRHLDCLIELCAQYNQLSVVPRPVKKLKNLIRLKLTGNKISGLEGVERLKKLQVLVVDENNIPTIPKELLNSLKRLELLHCGSNMIREMPGEIRLMRYLKDLDISNNKLTSLPPEILVLPRLEMLCASGNQISRIPTINVKGRVKRKIGSIDLSANALVKFPEHLVFMTDHLDLSYNAIKIIPATFIHKLDWNTDTDLILNGNPLSVPPPDVAECGIRAVMQFYQEVKSEMKVFQGLKILFVGGCNQGKTSLIQSLVDQQPRLTNDDRTMGIDFYHLRIDLDDEEALGKSLNLSLWDFSGNLKYIYQHTFFLEQPALVVIVFNMLDYSVDKFYALIGVWIDCIIAKANRMNVLVIGTHKDKLKPAAVKRVCRSVYKSIDDFVVEHKLGIEKEIKAIESLSHISPAMSEQLKHYINLLRVEFTLQKEVIPVSCLDYKDLDKLLMTIEAVACDKEIFPDVLKVVPSLWGEVENYIEERGYAMMIPVLTWDQFYQEISHKFGMKHLMEQIAKYLNDTGKVVWFSDNPLLKELVFLRPSWLADILKQVFRTDVEDMDLNSEESFKLLNITLTRFEKMKREILDDGLFDRDYLKCMWYSLTGTEMVKPILEVMSILAEKFEIGYPVLKVSRIADREKLSSAMSMSSRHGRDTLGSASTVRSVRFDQASSTMSSQNRERSDSISKPKDEAPPNILKIVVPWLRNNRQPKAFKDEYDRYLRCPSLAAVFRFPKFIPPGFFEVLIAQTLKIRSGYQVLHHWKQGLYAKNDDKPLRLYVQRITREDGSMLIRLELRLIELVDEEEKDTDLLWSVMLPMLKEVDDNLDRFAGIRVVRYIECPMCHSQSFLGEWQTPKELQGTSVKKCEQCQQQVDASFLIQPKERRRVEELIALKKRKQEAEKKKKTLETMQEEVEAALPSETPADV